MTLPVGARVPPFELSAPETGRRYSWRDWPGRRLVILFFPAGLPDELALAAGLSQYQDHLAAFAEQAADVIGISDSGQGQLARLGIRFPLLADPTQETARQFRVLDGGEISPTVYVADENGVIQAAYDASRYAGLPNPPIVLRAIRKLGGAPKPAPLDAQDWRLGPAEAPVVLIEYGDYQCPHCIELHRVLRELWPRYAGRFALVYRHLPLRQTHPLAQQAAEAAEAAGAQGRFWEMHHRLFDARGELSRDQLVSYARELGLGLDRFMADLDGRRWQDAVNADFKAAVERLIKLPPALFINGVQVEPPFTAQAVRARLDPLAA